MKGSINLANWPSNFTPHHTLSNAVLCIL